MDPVIKALAEAYSVPLSERSCYRSYLWDGKALATTWQRQVWSEDYNTLERVCPPEPIETFSLIHEIAHYVVADEVEREFPEYGCYVLGDCNSNPVWFDNYRSNGISYKLKVAEIEGVLTKKEQDFREACADFLGVYWCDLYGVPVRNDWRPVNKYSKYTLGDEYGLYETAWEAIIWLREKGLMTNEPNNDPVPSDGYAFVVMIRGRDWKDIEDEHWNNQILPITEGTTFVGTRSIDGSICNVWRSAHCRWYIAQVKRG